MGRDVNPGCSCRIRKRGRQPAEITREKRLCTQQTACAANGSRFRPPCCRRFSWDAVKQPRVHALRVLSLTPQLISVNYYSRRIDSLKKLLCGGPLPHQKCYPTPRDLGRWDVRAYMSLSARRELALRTAVRYKNAARPKKKRILDEFLASTGFHRKHATRLLNQILRGTAPARERRPRTPMVRPGGPGCSDHRLAHRELYLRQAVRAVSSRAVAHP